MFSIHLPQEFLTCQAGHSVHVCFLMVKLNCPLHNIKEFSTLDILLATDLVLEKSIQTVHVLLVETDSIIFCSNSLTSPISKM